ncbi:MFS transporter [Sphingomonas kyeonggiensis]|uniref:EmrB/QacA subfamily drug resistance transporter n=1 Tax=Sphingomonas kyeonggiensis TaxID=1268553 RepID=A0A7W6NWI1_9SPHN|nr:MFS transporter [Sphingomonas kyeonggiensis]MBB4098632.1 EmrB/QacA subfamily drug resistance transporter [Sphingomonas kyeonggiensis]
MIQDSAGKNRLALLAMCLGALMFGLEITSVPVILPTLERDLHGGFQDMQWVMNAYTLACTTVLMATGTLADRFGRKLLFLISVVAFGATSALCGIAQDMAVLIAGRFLQGLAGGAMLICSIALLSHQFRDARERSRAFATWGIVSGIGLGFGPLIGSAIIALAGWKWIFLVHLPLAALTLALAAGTVEESRDPEAKHLDAAGIATLSLSVFGLVYFITQGPALGLSGAMLVVGATAACFAAFLFVEHRQAHPMFDFSVFRNRDFSGAILGGAAMNVSYWPFMIYLPIYLQIGLGYDPLATGLCVLAYTLPALVFPPLGERLALRYGPATVIPLGLFAIGLGFLAMKLGSAAPQPGWSTLLPGLLLAGIGLGITNTPVTNTTTASVPPSRAGMASGMDMSARLITLAVNIAFMGFLLVEGIAWALQRASAADTARLRDVAQAIAAGDDRALAAGLSPALVRQGLAEGFGIVMLYGGVAVWVLAGLSFITFRAGAASRRRNAAECTG